MNQTALFICFCHVEPQTPVIKVIPFKNSIIVKLTKSAGNYSAQSYCMAIVETEQEECLITTRSNGKNVTSQQRNVTFTTLTANTTYTVKGWIINKDGVSGPKATKITNTLPEGKLLLFQSVLCSPLFVAHLQHEI